MGGGVGSVFGGLSRVLGMTAEDPPMPKKELPVKTAVQSEDMQYSSKEKRNRQLALSILTKNWDEPVVGGGGMLG